MDDAVTRLTFEKVGGRMNECGRAADGLSRAEVLTRRSAIPSGSNSGAMICKGGRHKHSANALTVTLTAITNTIHLYIGCSVFLFLIIFIRKNL